MTEHPLALLREARGLSHPAYAQLVARTHAELGYGNMAARREKVSRWESGRIVPHRTTQLAIAKIHGVSGNDVLRLGWPAWLHVAAREVVLAVQPWTFDGTIAVLASLGCPGAHVDSEAPVLVGRTLAGLVNRALAAVSDPTEPSHAGGYLGPGVVARVESRVAVLESMRSQVQPEALSRSVDGEFGFLASLLAGAGYGPATGARFLALISRICDLAAALHQDLADFAKVEEYCHVGVRLAVAAGAVSRAAGCFGRLALVHERLGDAADASMLADAVLALEGWPGEHPSHRAAGRVQD
ncbi:helix-turn-helix domain-containing protein [Kitasatospora sp. NPDC057904]|uniref:helix-turn-helix domain-containing protein n=1 Tax=unclassified Kitasatospora TaxID=2633591 RepID=UPI0036DDB4AE